MGKMKCGRCGREIENGVAYQCCRCFTRYCVSCEGSREGRVCPECGMGARLVLSSPTNAEEADHGAKK